MRLKLNSVGLDLVIVDLQGFSDGVYSRFHCICSSRTFEDSLTIYRFGRRLEILLPLSFEIQTRERPAAAARSCSMQGLLIIRQIAQ